jgi:ABC-type sugar transport system ATPase subunit
MLTRLREGTPDAAREARAGAAAAPLEEVGSPVRVTGLRHSFGELRAIERIDLEVEPGEVVGIVGPSGCGKTTLLELVAGLRPAGSGTVSVGGSTADGERLARSAYMPQRDLLLPWLSALDNAALALRIARVPRDQARARANTSAGSAWKASKTHARVSSPAACASAWPSCAP